MMARLTQAFRKEQYRSYLIALLAIILAFNSVDRLALGLVLQNIKADFSVTDTELGLLSGLAFAVFYSTLGIPIGRWADRGNRVAIIAITTGLWSVMVVLCGFAQSFAQLLSIRMGVAVGESGCIPPAYSLIGDNFSRVERPRAIANYFLGGSLSLVVGYFAAGWLNEVYGWRVTFCVLGAPGVVLAPLAWFTLREPRRVESVPRDNGILSVSRSLMTNMTYRRVVVAVCMHYFFGYGLAQWQPSFFIRSYQLSTGELGAWLAIVIGAGGFIGTYCGGRLATRYAPGDERLQLRVLAILWAGFAGLSAAAYLSNSRYMSFAFIGAATMGITLGTGSLFSAAQAVVPERMRAMSVSVLFLLANLIGMGLGPLVVGALSDALRPVIGQESLRYALLAMCPGYLLGSWQLWLAAKTVAADTEIALSDPRNAPVHYLAV